MRQLALAILVGLLPAVSLAQAPTDGAAVPPQRRLAILPYLGSAPETGIQYGATLFGVEQPADSATRASTAQLFAAYTAKGQARIFAEVDRWTRTDAWRLTGRVEWQRFPLPYYGFGDGSPSGAEEIYTPKGVLLLATAQRRIRGPLYAHAGYRYQDIQIAGASDGVLIPGTVIGGQGGRVGQLQGGALWDSRDNPFTPETGSFVQLTGSVASGVVGSEFDFRRLVIDARRYLRLGEHQVLAMQGVLETTGGAAPFDQVSLVGNSNYLRGYTRGRFRDRHLASVQAEYRAPIAGRLGGAAFAGVGRVAPSVTELVGADARLLPSYGVGVRWLLFPRTRSTVRLDYGRGADGQSGIYVAFNEAF